MYLNEKLIKNADLVVPFVRCPIGDAVSNCPFIAFWAETDTGKRVKMIEDINDNDLDQLRNFHQTCLLKKLEQMEG